MSESIKKRLMSSANGLYDGIGNTMVDASFVDQSSEWPLSQEDLSPDKNPFLEMSQDQIQKLDAVLSSEQAKRILGETSEQYELNEPQQKLPFSLGSESSEALDKTLEDSLSFIMNGANLSMLGHKSEDFLQAFESSSAPIQVVGSDLLVEDVEVEMATEILAEEIVDSGFDIGFIESCILMDHNYCMIPVPEQSNEVQVTAEELQEREDSEDLSSKRTDEEEEEAGDHFSEAKNKGHVSELCDSIVSPIRRSQRQIEKVEREQLEKIKAENAEIQRKEKEEMIRIKHLEEEQKHSERLLNVDLPLTQAVLNLNDNITLPESGTGTIFSANILPTLNSPLNNQTNVLKTFESVDGGNEENVPVEKHEVRPTEVESSVSKQADETVLLSNSLLISPNHTEEVPQNKHNASLRDGAMLPNEMLLEGEKSPGNLRTDVLGDINLDFPSNIPSELSKTVKSEALASTSTEVVPNLEVDKAELSVAVATFKTVDCSKTIVDQPSKVNLTKKDRRDSIDKIDEAFGRVVVRRLSEGLKKDGDKLIGFGKQDSTRKSYPKRENRKPPGYLMDMFEPALFSKPDRMKKIDTRYDYKSDALDEDGRKTALEIKPETDDSFQTDSKDQDVDDSPSTFSSRDILSHCVTAVETKTNKIEEFLCKTEGDVMIVEHEHQDGVMDILEIKGSPVSSDAGKDYNPLTIDEDPKTQKSHIEKHISKDKLRIKEKRQRRVLKKQVSGARRKAKQGGKRLLSRGSKKTLDVDRQNDSSSNEEDQDGSDDSDWCSEDDPDRLWCICKQPHNDRFMISCDKCEDWFHGSCVGVTRKLGRELEKSGKEWVCQKCTKERLQEKDLKNVQKLGVTEMTVAKLPPIIHGKQQKGNFNFVERKVIKPSKLQKGNKHPLSTKFEASEKTGRLLLNPVARVPSVEKISREPCKPSAHSLTEDDKSPSVSSVPGKATTQLCVMGCQRPARANSVFCGNECILQHAGESLEKKGLGKDKEKAQPNKQIQELFKPEQQVVIKHVSVIERRTGRILSGPSAPNERNLQEWLKLHPNFEVLSPTQRIPDRHFYGPQRKMTKLIQPQPMPVELTSESSKVKTIVRPAAISIEKKEDKKILPDQKMKFQGEVKSKLFVEVKPKIADQKMKFSMESKPKLLTDMKTKVATVELTRIKSQELSKPKPVSVEVKSKVASESKVKPPMEIKPKGTTDVKQPPPTPPSPQTSQGPEPVRVNVRKTLQEILTMRSKDTDDTQISADEIQKISHEIEEELFKMFNDTGTKYKAKYRSLMFNIKDQRNHGLFRKILRGKIKPDKLVRMTPEELASKELAMWREREAKHTLEMIKREQEEQQQQHTTIIKKTHKGEIEIDDDGLGFTEKPKSKQEAVSEPLSPMMIDTTDSHRSHLFDLNCKICTGKMLAPSDGQPSPKKVRVAKSISLESRSQDENENEGSDDKEEQKDDTELKSVVRPEKEDIEEKLRENDIEVVKEKIKHKKKDKEKKKHLDNKVKTKEGEEKTKGTHKENNPVEVDTRTKSKDKQEKTKGKNKQDKMKDKRDKSKDKDKPDKVKSTSKKDRTKDSSIKKVKKSDAVTKSILKQDIADREPSSTVTISSPDSALPGQSDDSKSAHPSVWKGFVMMQDVAKFVTNAYKVSGPTDFLAQDIPDTIQVCGRIAPNTVWDYLSKVKQSGNKEFLVIRFSPANEEEKVAYVSFYSYLSSRNRFGVVGNSSRMIKDFYILPLASHSSIPATLHPLDGPGLEETRPHMLLGIIIRHKSKRRTSSDGGSDITSKPGKRNLQMADSIENSNDSCDVTIISKDAPSSSKKVKFDLNVKPSSAADGDAPYEPSYTPPLEDLPKPSSVPDGSSPYEPSFTPPLDQMPKTSEENDSPYSPGHSDLMEEDDANKPYDPEEAEEAVKMSKKIIPGLLAGSVSSQSVSELIDQISMSSNPTEITTTVLASIATATNLEQQRKLLIELTQKVEEQKRQLEMQKQQIATKVTAQVMGAIAPFSMVPNPSFTSTSVPSGLSLDPKDGTKSALPHLDFESLHQSDEAYSPSYTPPLEGSGLRSASDSLSAPSQLPSSTLKLPDTSNISLPPNLQEILESIKKQGAVTSATDIAFTGPLDSKNISFGGGASTTKDEVKINVLEEDPIIKKFSGDVVDPVHVPDDELPPGVEAEKCKGVEELKSSSTKQSDPRLKGKTIQNNPRLKVSVSTPVAQNQLSGLESQKRSELGSLSASELMEKALKQFEDLPPPPPPPPQSSSSTPSLSPVVDITLLKTGTSSSTKRRSGGQQKGSKSSVDSSSKNGKSTFSATPLKEPPPPGLEDIVEDPSCSSMLTQQGASSQMVTYPIPPGPFVPNPPPPPPPPYPGPPPGFGTQSIFPAYQTSYPAPNSGGYWASDHGGQQDWRGGGPRFRGRGRGRWEGGTRGTWNDHHPQDGTGGSTPEWGFRDKDERNRDWPRERDNDRDDRDRYRDRDRRDDRRERNKDRDRNERDRSRVRDKDRDRSRSRHRD